MTGPIGGVGGTRVENPQAWGQELTVEEAERNWAQARSELATSFGPGTLIALVREAIAESQYMDAIQREYGVMPDLRIGGSADPHDVTLVAAELAKMPESYRQMLADNDRDVVVCRGSVTDYATDLRGVQPRGWPPGSTWDSVPGLYAPPGKPNEIVIATRGHGTPEGPHVPETGDGHGSANLVLHEAAHAIHSVVGNQPDFLAARQADLAALDPYQTQPGDAGIQETFAESFANFFGGTPDYASTHPNLHRYWANHS